MTGGAGPVPVARCLAGAAADALAPARSLPCQKRHPQPHWLVMPYHDPTGDLMAYRQFCLIADKIAADPALLEIPLANITRWLANGHWAKRELGQWQTWIEEARHSAPALQRLLDLLRDDGEDARDWKGFSPFPGILSKAERGQFICTSRH